MVEASAWMQLNHLVVLDSQVVACPFKMRCLHEKASYKSLANVHVVLAACEVRACTF